MEESHYDFMYHEEMFHWWYRVRRSIVINLFKDIFHSHNDLVLLDAGCGTGAMMKELERFGKVHGMDESKKAVVYCRSRSIQNVLRGNITALPYPDNMFDAVVILDVLEHVRDDNLALEEIYRVLKPQGYCIIFVPAFTFLWSITDEISHHFRRYTLLELSSKVNKIGFEIVRKSYFNFFLFVPILVIRKMVKLFHIPIKSEDGSSKGVVNYMLYVIFYMESLLLRIINLPFGVSALIVCRKNDK